MDVLGATPGSLLLDQAATGAEDARLRRLAGRTGSREDLANLRETAQEFEAVFLNQLMKVMRETVPENDLFNSGGATKFYRQMHDAEIARAMATGRSGLGVADLIVQQFAASVGEGRDQAAGDLSPGAASAAPPTPAAASERLPEPLI
ncbi:rod-binding protein, partial [bacterium]|nr:rod-binding protein [bacterium]